MNSSEATNFVFNITKENNRFSLSTPDHSSPEDGEEPINKVNKYSELRSENDIELHVEEFEREVLV